MIRLPCTRAITATGVALLIATVPAHARDDGVPAEAYAVVNMSLVEHHVLPRYERLAAASEALARGARELCSGTGAPALEALRARYHDAMDAWMGVQHIRFGPVELFMRSYRLYFWPAARGKVDDAVRALVAAGEREAFAPERFHEASVAAQGLPAVEHLLYADAGIGTGAGSDRVRCRLLEAITVNMRGMARGIVVDWRGGDAPFARAVASPGADNTHFATHREAALAFFKSLYGGLRLIADVRLAPVFGETVEAARPRLAESRLSGRALRNVVANLEALEALYRGEGGPGLSHLARALGDDPELDPLLRKAFAMTVGTARSIGRPLGEAVTDPSVRPAVDTLLTRVRALEQLVRTRLAVALDLQVGFNALDGD